MEELRIEARGFAVSICESHTVLGLGGLVWLGLLVLSIVKREEWQGVGGTHL